jgi:hypothetical protein
MAWKAKSTLPAAIGKSIFRPVPIGSARPAKGIMMTVPGTGGFTPAG